MGAAIRIRSVDVRLCEQRSSFRGTYTDGSVDPDYRLLVVAISNGKETGFGECVPTSIIYPSGAPGRVGIDEWKGLLDLCATVPGQDARRLSRLVPDNLRGYDTSAIIDAVEFALYDLVGRQMGVPVATLLGGMARPYVWGMPVVHTLSPDEMADRAAGWYRKFGFRYYKLKPIGNREADVETLRKMRERTGPEVRFYADAGLDMSPDELIVYLNELAEFGLETYEDPIRADWDTYRLIRGRTKVKLMLDEDVRALEPIFEAARARCVDMINIHANWAGGFDGGLRKAAVAAAGGIAAMIGSTHYFGPGAAAYQTMSSVLPFDTPCEQMHSELVYGVESAITDPYEVRDGKIFIRDAPGLGVSVVMEKIEERTLRRETFTA